MPLEVPSPFAPADPVPANRPGQPGSVESLLVVFQVDRQRYALRLAAVERLLHAMEIAPLPGAPGAVAGVINVAGQVVPVLDLRRRFGLPAREARLSDVLILARANGRTVALPADGVDAMLLRPDAVPAPADSIYPGLRHVAGVVQLDDGLAFIHDVDAFLSATDRERLDRALDGEDRPS